jgi:hypothetical protein
MTLVEPKESSLSMANLLIEVKGEKAKKVAAPASIQTLIVQEEPFCSTKGRRIGRNGE